MTAESAKRLADEQRKGKDVVAVFGRSFTSTLDLPFRVREGIEFSGFDMRTFFCAQGGEGVSGSGVFKGVRSQG